MRKDLQKREIQKFLLSLYTLCYPSRAVLLTITAKACRSLFPKVHFNFLWTDLHFLTLLSHPFRCMHFTCLKALLQFPDLSCNNRKLHYGVLLWNIEAMKVSWVCLKIIHFSEKALQHMGTDPAEERTPPLHLCCFCCYHGFSQTVKHISQQRIPN